MDTVALYIHWPFCLSKCPYCDFNSHVRDVIPQARMVAALRAELRFEAARVGRRRVTSVFFGGGTPSLLNPENVGALLADVRGLFEVEAGAEITLEANPTSVEAGRFAGYAAAGVNRVSIGVQSLQADALKFLGREHSVEQAVAALEVGRKIFPRISFDLIYARPGQTEAAWRAEVRAALSLAADHLSLYQLTIEEGTKFHTLFGRGDFVLPDEALGAALYEATAEEAGKFGLAGYEISNYAKAGGESRHNLAYWRYEDYVGIGPGAHGRVTLDGKLLATSRHRGPEAWAELVERTGTGGTREEEISAADRAREALLMGLRLAEGVRRDRFAARTGLALEDAVDRQIFADCVAAGYLTLDADRIVATAEGRRRLDAMLPRLLL